MNLLSEIASGTVPNLSHLPTKEIILQAGIAQKAKSLCENSGNVLVVCDENTKDFVSIPNAKKIIFPGGQKADLATAKALSRNPADFFVAVGSGSLNDIVKYASYLAAKPYSVFGTAPSMNGYVSANASLLDGGYKKSFTAHAPQSVYLDLEILQSAPKRLIASGVGDAYCRATAEADALLSHQIKHTPSYAELFALVKKHEEEIFTDISALTKTLIFGGLAMLLAGSSAPASGGEHMLAHYMELMQPTAPASFHGEQIAVTTITMAALQEKLLNEKDYVEVETNFDKKIQNHFTPEHAGYFIEQTSKKYTGLTKTKLNKHKIEATLISAEKMRHNLKLANAPLTPTDLGWDNSIYTTAQTHAKFTRDRFTFLDLA